MLRLAVLVCISITLCQGYKTFQDRLPNGGNVPHPCKSNYIWEGVGHQNALGGGARNPFGVAFLAAGSEWTLELCNEDSDGDGMLNGQELGDPDCIWDANTGEAPARTTNLTHPGVCEDTTSSDCLALNAWDIDCSEGDDFICEGLGPDVVNVTLTFDRTLVPATETNYYCQSFQIPDDKEYHMIGSKPYITNSYVMHHTLVYGCRDGIEGYETPRACGMANEACSQLIASWTLGSSGYCESSTDGFLVGKGHFTTILMEHHWNNPTQEVNYYDESGMTLFLTPNIRQNNLGYFITGQYHLELPPGRFEVTATGVCHGDCVLRKISAPMYITSAHLHMHYLGASGSIEHWRDGALVSKWFHEERYSYDSPVINTFDPPLEFLPGDEVRTICNFNTMGREGITITGEATSDEMCYGFMNYYPAEHQFSQCVSYKESNACDIEDWYEYEDPDDKDPSAATAIHFSLALQVLPLITSFYYK